MEDGSLITEIIPLTLMQKYLQKGFHLFIDNYYTSVSLATYLLQNGTYIIRTIRDTRKHFPVELKTMTLKKGETAFYQHNGLVAIKYRAMKDRTTGKTKVVYVLSTAHATAIGHTNKRVKDGNVNQKPTCINVYNHSMGGVDMMDQQLEDIDVLRMSYKWYKKLFLGFVMQCALSAQKLYGINGTKDGLLHFLLDVCIQLLLNAPRFERPLRRPAVDNIVRLTGRSYWQARRETTAEWKGASPN